MSKRVLERLQSHFGQGVIEVASHCGDETAVVAPSLWFEAAKFLRDDPACDMSLFIDITAVDYPDREARFDLILFLYSLHKQQRVRLKTHLFDEYALGLGDAARPTRVPTLIPLYAAANWFEREVWDMFGIKFEGHPDLRRILLYEEFEGHPLRKDYPAEKTQPLVPYREGPDVFGKLPPFLADEGMPFGRRDWAPRDAGWGPDTIGDRADVPPPDGTAPVPTSN